MRAASLRAKLTEWLTRYLLLEIAATACALVGGLAMASLTDNGVAIAYAATWAENLGFYGFALGREIRKAHGPERFSLASFGQTLLPSTQVLIAEFGVAEVLDSFVIRPACMYFLPKVMVDLATGLVVGKLLADVAFYGLAVLAYERRKSNTKTP